MTNIDLFKYLINLEMSLLTPEVRLSRARLDELIHPDFREISLAGTWYDKTNILENLPTTSRGNTRYEASDFHVQMLGENLAQVTFQTISKSPETGQTRQTLRSSLWKYEGNCWQIIFHQGTPAPQA